MSEWYELSVQIAGFSLWK